MFIGVTTMEVGVFSTSEGVSVADGETAVQSVTSTPPLDLRWPRARIAPAPSYALTRILYSIIGTG